MSIDYYCFLKDQTKKNYLKAVSLHTSKLTRILGIHNIAVNIKKRTTFCNKIYVVLDTFIMYLLIG